MKSNHRQFVEALTECQETLRAYCYAKIGNWDDAADVMQATNVKLWKKMDEWDQKRPFLPWALGVARNTVLSHYRDQQRERLVFDEDVMTIMEKHILAAAEKTPALIQALRHCMRKMEDQPREILKAHYIEGWSLAEIADSGSRSASGIKSLLFRLRRELAKCIDREVSA